MDTKFTLLVPPTFGTMDNEIGYPLIKWLDDHGYVVTRLRDNWGGRSLVVNQIVYFVGTARHEEACSICSESITRNGLNHAAPLLELHKNSGGPSCQRKSVIDAIMPYMEDRAAAPDPGSPWDHKHLSPKVLAERTRCRAEKATRELEEARRNIEKFL